VAVSEHFNGHHASGIAGALEENEAPPAGVRADSNTHPNAK